MNSRNRSTVIILFSLIVAMTALAFASVPLYRIFCQKTGFGGTPQISKTMSKEVSDRIIEVQFTATTHRHLPWRFQPLQNRIKVKVGENALAFYQAENLSDRSITGMATYNVTPDKAGIYFNKVACFCFEQQELLPKQQVDMPVQFYIDQEILNDPYLNDVKTITLSYTFFEYKP